MRNPLSLTELSFHEKLMAVADPSALKFLGLDGVAGSGVSAGRGVFGGSGVSAGRGVFDASGVSTGSAGVFVGSKSGSLVGGAPGGRVHPIMAMMSDRLANKGLYFIILLSL